MTLYRPLETSYKLLFISFTLLFMSCSSVFIYAPKNICVHGNAKEIKVTGSDLDGNKLDQKSDGNLKIPLSP